VGGDPSEDLRGAALDALDSLARDEARVARVTADVAAKDPSLQVRVKAVNLLRPPADPAMSTLVAALDDPNPQVRLAAGTKLAWVGLSDDRTVPAICHAALKADDVTREGIAIYINQLILDRPNDPTPADQVTRRYLTAVREFRKVLETREAAARTEVVTVLGRLIASYEKSHKPSLLEPARAALEAVLARMEDEAEDVPLRLHAMNQWSLVQILVQTMGDPGPEAARRDELHATALWIAALGKQLKSPASAIRTRAVEILVDSFKDKVADAPFREAWRQLVPALAEATRSEDVKVRNGALTILRSLGPEAAQALEALRSLARESKDPAVKSAVEETIKSLSSADDLKQGNPEARIAAAATLGRLGWRATPALPALIAALKDSEVKVRIAAADALGNLGPLGESAVAPLAAALAGGETDPAFRLTVLKALDAIAPSSRPVIDAHLGALRGPDSKVRAAAAAFPKVPADDPAVQALAAALADPSAEVRRAVAGSLTRILFENPAVITTLAKAMRDEVRRKDALQALDEHFEKTTDSADFGGVRGNPKGFEAALAAAIPALRELLSLKDEGTRLRAYAILGRIVAFARLARDEGLRKAIEPALEIYLKGLDEGDAEIRGEVLGRLDAVPIRRAEIVSALLRYLERSDQSAEDRAAALAALAAQAAHVGSDAGLLERVKPAIPLLVRALDDPEPAVRGAAIQALGQIDGEAKAAEEGLRRLARNDPEPKNRKGAEDALKAIDGTARMPPPPRRGGGGGRGNARIVQ
jgi:HEAT repeat protein